MTDNAELDAAAVVRTPGRAAESAAPGGTRVRPRWSPDSSFPPAGIAFCVFGAAHIAAAAAIAAVNTATPIAHGWWLVSYLVLVGGLAQALLGGGLAALAAAGGVDAASETETLAQLVLWNVGTAAVAVADVTAVPAGVLVGSLLLLAALASFAHSCARAMPGLRPRTRRTWGGAYFALVVFLAGSVAVGTGLAGALPGQ
jgi:hypothetical protein